MRGSDPDAAVYYLAKMLDAGESVTFIARRIMICASEDVGNADPQAIVVATACAQAVERIGMPESQIILAHAATYVACAPKSNSVVNAIFAANDAVKKAGGAKIPVYLRDAHYSGAKDLGVSGYKYAHDYPKHYVDQQYLPDELAGERFYEPGDNGYEKNIKEWFKEIKK
jgi:putative ATPase